MGKNIKTVTYITGESARYDDDVLRGRVSYAAQISAKVKAGEITPQEGTRLLNEYGKKHKHML